MLETERTGSRGQAGTIPSNRRLHDVNSAADRLNCSRSSVYNLIKTGQLHPLKLGKLTRFTDEELDRLIASLSSEEAA